jgi:hypothetical protein
MLVFFFISQEKRSTLQSGFSEFIVGTTWEPIVEQWLA